MQMHNSLSHVLLFQAYDLMQSSIFFLNQGENNYQIEKQMTWEEFGSQKTKQFDV